MIINALCGYYERLLETPDADIAPPNYSKAKVSHEIIIDGQGEIVGVMDLRVNEGKKLFPRLMDVPEQGKRSSGISPNFLCDNSTYVFGIDKKKKPDRAKDAFFAFREFNKSILQGCEDAAAEAFIRYLDRWQPEEAENHPVVMNQLEELTKGSFIVFRLKGDKQYIHQRKAVGALWQKYKETAVSDVLGQCLVTGDNSPIARLHPNIQGVVDAQSSGASIVSFNLPAFESYGKSQSFNAPVSEKAAFAYTTALNCLLKDNRHRLRIGDATVVFWAEKPAELEEDLLAELLNISRAEDAGVEEGNGKLKADPRTAKIVRDILKRAREGRPVFAGLDDIDPNTTFYILGLSPNNSRLSVRFWHVNSFGALVETIAKHYSDMEIVKRDFEDDYIPLWRILKETAPLGDSKRVSPLLAGAVMRSILTGSPYPQSLYTGMLSRIRAENQERPDGKGKKDKINYVRAAVLKACLVRNTRKYQKSKDEVVNVSLDTESTDRAYRLGRLFALLEKAQQDANPGINATIKDRYFGSASATPVAVLPILMRLSQHHLSKAEYGFSIDKKIEEVMTGIESFPAHLNLEEQGRFMLGYYHQRHALYQKAEKEEGVKND